MSKFVKYSLILAGGLVLLVLAAVVIVPRVVDVQKYKTQVVEKIAASTGRPVSLGGDLKISVFPWVGVSFTDFRLGSPQGFESKEFVVVKSFEAHVKLMPLFSREVQVDSFVLDEPEIYLEKGKDGRGNWEGLVKTTTGKPPEKEPAEKTASEGQRLKSIEIREFSIHNARIRFVDRLHGGKNEISDLNLQLTDISLERPIELSFSGVVDGRKIAANGSFGPLGPKPGEGPLSIDLVVTAVEQLEAKVKGQLNNSAGKLSFQLAVDVPTFSPKKVMSAFNTALPFITGDPGALEAAAFSMNLSGSEKGLSFTGGKLTLDSSNMDFTGEAKSFAPLNLILAGNIDAMDLDRYLPAKAAPAKGKGAAAGATADGTTGKGAVKKTDYEPLRKISLDTKFTIGELKVRGGKLQQVQLQLTGKNGVFQLNPLVMELYSGNVLSTATVNVQGVVPATSVKVKTTNVQVGPMLRDFAKKDVLEGALAADVALSMTGDTSATAKRSLNGKGELIFTDGAVVGIDLAGMVRNVQASFGLAERSTEKPRTDFAELRAPFTLTNGRLNTPGTTMQSPLLRVTAVGDADLVSEKLDMKIQPKFVATLKGQGDTDLREGLMVPVLVGGTLSSPQFTPDLTAMLKGQLPDAESVKKVLEEGVNPGELLPKDQGGGVEEGIKKLIPKLPF